MSQTAISISQRTKMICILSSSCGQRHLRRIRRSVQRVVEVCTATIPIRAATLLHCAMDIWLLGRSLRSARILTVMVKLTARRSSCSSSEVSGPPFHLRSRSRGDQVEFSSGISSNFTCVHNSFRSGRLSSNLSVYTSLAG